MPPAGRPLLAVLCVAQFVDVLDVNAVLVALPAIGRSLELTPGELQWVVTAYVLVFAGFLLLAGRLADLYGRRRLFMIGLLIFTLASLACGLARDPLTLIAARAVQGLGAAITAPAALAIITTNFNEGAERSAALAVWTAVAAGGGAAGLVLGGVITDALGWEWIFFVNVPVGLTALVLGPFALPESRGDPAPRGLDLAGAVTVTGALALIVFAFSHAERAGPGSAVVLGSLAAGLLLALAFLLVERRTGSPLVPLELLRSGELAGPMLVAGVLTATTSAAGVLATLYLQNVLGYSPGVAGLAALPLSVAVIAGSSAGPALMRRAGATSTMALGLAWICCGALIASRISPTEGLGYVLAAGALSGVGLGAASVAATARGTGSVSEEKRGLASGLLTSSAQVGTALGIAAFVWLASARTDALSPGRPTPETIVQGYEAGLLSIAALAAATALAATRYLRGGSLRGARG
ncbi:MAG TPA: MFS transporter [Thermoleophilaceae bacterium]|nr:MFS transporter [Thermoleophilaceae bacterium]